MNVRYCSSDAPIYTPGGHIWRTHLTPPDGHNWRTQLFWRTFWGCSGTSDGGWKVRHSQSLLILCQLESRQDTAKFKLSLAQREKPCSSAVEMAVAAFGRSTQKGTRTETPRIRCASFCGPSDDALNSSPLQIRPQHRGYIIQDQHRRIRISIRMRVRARMRSRTDKAM